MRGKGLGGEWVGVGISLIELKIPKLQFHAFQNMIDSILFFVEESMRPISMCFRHESFSICATFDARTSIE